jgi:hypothetical protein
MPVIGYSSHRGRINAVTTIISPVIAQYDKYRGIYLSSHSGAAHER